MLAMGHTSIAVHLGCARHVPRHVVPPLAAPGRSAGNMDHTAFVIGLEFWKSGARWRCTDVGTRTVVAIKLEHENKLLQEGPPYAVDEYLLDEYDLPACYPVHS
jgi:hypothetical protein